MPLTTAYEHDVDGRLRRLSYPSGLVIELVRDPVTGEVVAVRDARGAPTYASAVVRRGAGAWASLTFGNGQPLAQTYTLRGEPLSLRSGPVELEHLITPAGDVGVVTDTSVEPSGCRRSVDRSLAYDHQDRLTAWSDSVRQGDGLCAPDGLGGGAAGFSFVSGTDQVAGQVAGDGAPQYAFGYDGQGNVSAIGRYDGGGALVERVCLRHDALGRLVLVGTTGTAFGPGGTACVSDAEVTAALGRYRYDWRNLRVASQRGGVWTHTVFDAGGQPLSELQLTEDPAAPWRKQRDYVWLDGRLLAQVEYQGSDGGGAIYFAHLDHLGQPRALTSTMGQVVWASYQRPYGEVLEKTAPDAQTGRTVVTNLRLPGQYDERLLGSLGLQGPYYNWNRWYLPSVGRYLELDPIAKAGGFNGFYGPNWYGYAEGNPLRWTDPHGLDATDEWNTADGCRLPFLLTGSAPTNGMWCGNDWSGGNGTCRGQGQSPPTDSLDLACMHHDLCYSECAGHRSAALLQACRVLCDSALTREVQCLGPDLRRWPGPPRPGTEADTANYRESLLSLFGCPPKERNTCPK